MTSSPSGDLRWLRCARAGVAVRAPEQTAVYRAGAYLQIQPCPSGEPVLGSPVEPTVSSPVETTHGAPFETMQASSSAPAPAEPELEAAIIPREMPPTKPTKPTVLARAIAQSILLEGVHCPYRRHKSIASVMLTLGVKRPFTED